jgi:hypothetical protein
MSWSRQSNARIERTIAARQCWVEAAASVPLPSLRHRVEPVLLINHVEFKGRLGSFAASYAHQSAKYSTQSLPDSTRLK